MATRMIGLEANAKQKHTVARNELLLPALACSLNPLQPVLSPPPLSNPSSCGSFSSWSTASSALYQSSDPDAENANLRPIPAMPSDLFQQLALSQLELLANSLRNRKTSKRKIESMALHLPQENGLTGQLEFLPAVIYPHPSMERIFIASDADSGLAPTLPKSQSWCSSMRSTTQAVFTSNPRAQVSRFKRHPLSNEKTAS